MDLESMATRTARFTQGVERAALDDDSMGLSADEYIDLMTCLEEALALLDRMRKRNIERSTVTYNSLLHVLHRSGRWRLALKMLKEMRREKVRVRI